MSLPILSCTFPVGSCVPAGNCASSRRSSFVSLCKLTVLIVAACNCFRETQYCVVCRHTAAKSAAATAQPLKRELKNRVVLKFFPGMHAVLSSSVRGEWGVPPIFASSASLALCCSVPPTPEIEVESIEDLLSEVSA